MPGWRPARILTTAWLARVMSGNSPERAKICPRVIGSSSRPARAAGSSRAGEAPLVDGTVDMRGPFLEGWVRRPAVGRRGTDARGVGARESRPRVRSVARREPGDLVAQRVVGGPLGQEGVERSHVAADRVA